MSDLTRTVRAARLRSAARLLETAAYATTNGQDQESLNKISEALLLLTTTASVDPMYLVESELIAQLLPTREPDTRVRGREQTLVNESDVARMVRWAIDTNAYGLRTQFEQLVKECLTRLLPHDRR